MDLFCEMTGTGGGGGDECLHQDEFKKKKNRILKKAYQFDLLNPKKPVTIRPWRM